MEEKDLQLAMICFNVCVHGVSLCVSADKFELDDCETYSSFNKLEKALADEENVVVHIDHILLINGSKMEFRMVTDDSGQLHILAAKYHSVSGLYADADYEYTLDENVTISGVRIFFKNNEGVQEYIWDSGAFFNIAKYNQNQFSLILDTL